MADDRTNQHEHSREAAKLCFEFFKHFTTITTAVALVELTLVQLFELSSNLVSFGLVASGITLFLSIWGMVSLALTAAVDNELPETGFGTSLLIGFSAFTFLIGVVMFALIAAVPTRTDTSCIFAPPFC